MFYYFDFKIVDGLWYPGSSGLSPSHVRALLDMMMIHSHHFVPFLHKR